MKTSIQNNSIEIIPTALNDEPDNSCLEELNNVIKNSHEVLDETEIAAALLAIFFHLKLTQTAFKVITDFINLMSINKVPNSFD